VEFNLLVVYNQLYHAPSSCDLDELSYEGTCLVYWISDYMCGQAVRCCTSECLQRNREFYSCSVAWVGFTVPEK